MKWTKKLNQEKKNKQKQKKLFKNMNNKPNTGPNYQNKIMALNYSI